MPRLGETTDRELGGGVGAENREPLDRRDGGSVDDLALHTEFVEFLRRHLDAEEHREHIDGVDLLEVLLGNLHQLLDLCDAGVVDQDIEPTQFLGDFINSCLEIGLIGNIECDEVGFLAGGFDVLENLCRGLLLVGEVCDGNIKAIIGEFFCDCAADALGTSGDKCYFAHDLDPFLVNWPRGRKGQDPLASLGGPR